MFLTKILGSGMNDARARRTALSFASRERV